MSEFEAELVLSEVIYDRLGLDVRDVGPERGPYSGFVILGGPSDLVEKVALALSRVGGYEGERRQRTAQKNIRSCIGGRVNMDVDIPGKRGKKMMRFQVRDLRKGRLELDFGGGGNRTTLLEMRSAIDGAARLVLGEKQNSS